MRIAHTLAELRQARAALALENAGPDAAVEFGLVPTMGALHDGHRFLLHRARQECGLVAATIFVNPLQFAPAEDLDRYPRTFAADCRMLEAEGIDLLFAPSSEEMYPDGAVTLVQVSGIEDRLDGASRPGHFRGVATVVAKLFHLIQPTRAYFGQKDAAQVAVLRQMVRDLNFPLTLAVCPTVRDPDGLALSSRNRYLTSEERTRALILPRTLHHIETRIAAGERTASTLLADAHARLTADPGIELDYLSIVHPDTLLPVDAVAPGTLIAIAAHVGATRLIDNLLAP